MKSFVLVEVVGGVMVGVAVFPPTQHGQMAARSSLKSKVISYLSESMPADEAVSVANSELSDDNAYGGVDGWTSGDGETDMAIHFSDGTVSENFTRVVDSANTLWEAVVRYAADHLPDAGVDSDAAAAQFVLADSMNYLEETALANEAAQETIAAMRKALAAAKEALMNVPMVGEEYDQQHSDTHQRAALLIDAVLA